MNLNKVYFSLNKNDFFILNCFFIIIKKKKNFFFKNKIIKFSINSAKFLFSVYNNFYLIFENAFYSFKISSLYINRNLCAFNLL